MSADGWSPRTPKYSAVAGGGGYERVIDERGVIYLKWMPARPTLMKCGVELETSLERAVRRRIEARRKRRS